MHRDKIAQFRSGLALLGIAAVMLPLTVSAQDATPEPADAMTVNVSSRATLADAGGNLLGEVSVLPFGENLFMVQVNAIGLTPGFHGFHIHTTGICDPSGDTPFSSAGPHLNPDGVDHPQHAGDLPVLYVAENGTASMAVVTDRFTLDELFDDDGSAVIVHGSTNNFANIPERYGGPDAETLGAGDSGPSVACGVFETGNMDAATTEEAAG